MADYLTGLPIIASTNITCSTFVSMDTTNGFAVIQATGATAMIAGIAQKGADIQSGFLPMAGVNDNNYAATPGQPVMVYGPAQTCKLLVGSGGCFPGSLLTTDGTGKGIIATSNQYYGAWSLDFGNSGDLVDVVTAFGKV
jgi:hypothetical protein